MATVLEFPAVRAPMARPAGPMAGAEIVLFPGVRFERRETTPEDKASDDGRRN